MAGQSQREIKRRIRSVRSMQQITRALQIVSAAKLRRVQGTVLAGRPYMKRLTETLAHLAQAGQDNLHHPLLVPRPVQRVAYCVVTADRGLAGGYNINLIRHAHQAVRNEQHPCHLVLIGRKGRDYFRRHEYEITAEYVGLSDDISWYEARDIATRLEDDFLEGRADEVYLVYMEFKNVLRHEPVIRKLLPLAAWPEHGEGEAPAAVPYIVEPSLAHVVNVLAPRYVETTVHQILLEAKASEHGARMSAMHNATDNAEEMIERLTLNFNRARQASITKDIAEIVGGAEALADV